LKLYIHEPASAAMNAWRRRTKGALPMTPHGRFETVNGICLAAFRKVINAEALSDAIASFDEDLAEGRYVEADVLSKVAFGPGAAFSSSRSPAVADRGASRMLSSRLGTRQFSRAAVSIAGRCGCFRLNREPVRRVAGVITSAQV
jgi:hypothetical protein